MQRERRAFLDPHSFDPIKLIVFNVTSIALMVILGLAPLRWSPSFGGTSFGMLLRAESYAGIIPTTFGKKSGLTQ